MLPHYAPVPSSAAILVEEEKRRDGRKNELKRKHRLWERNFSGLCLSLELSFNELTRKRDGWEEWYGEWGRKAVSNYG